MAVVQASPAEREAATASVRPLLQLRDDAPAAATREPFSNPEEFDPGIRDVVNALTAAGFKTTDSGDGYSKAAAIAAGEALPFRHVACAVSRSSMFREADRLARLLGPRWLVEASYHPPEGYCLLFASETEQVGS